jgi:hypothetical protein
MHTCTGFSAVCLTCAFACLLVYLRSPGKTKMKMISPSNREVDLSLWSRMLLNPSACRLSSL